MIEGDFSVEAVREHYDRLSVFYGALWGEHIHHGYWEDGESPARAQVKLVERLAAGAHIPRNSRVLDVGCGIGGPALWLARNLNCSVLGLTISPVQARMATARAQAEGLNSHLRFEIADANQLQFDEEGFDVVWVIECSEHLTDKARFIESCARALKPGGVLALCTWLTADEYARPEHAQLIAAVCDGMLCPQLASMRDYTNWMLAGGFKEIEAEDITQQVKETWTHCTALTSRPDIEALLRMTDERTRRFVETFEVMRRAYAEGATSYGMFTARKL
ncbi:MAG: methyltransferase domain-containing protein [Pyrinomonadaceae bacterium]|nr:methyltransferase domain-containing protein [Pyrinomonadaceae bacterium]